MDLKSEIISMLISMLILHVLLFNILKNHLLKFKNNLLKLRGNTITKKILSCVAFALLLGVVTQYLDASNISYNRIYSGILMGTYLELFAGSVSTENWNINGKEWVEILYKI